MSLNLKCLYKIFTAIYTYAFEILGNIYIPVFI